METKQVNAVEEQQSMLDTINDYFQGGSTGNIEQLRRAFHQDAQVRSVKMGELVKWSLEQYLSIVSKAPMQQRRLEIINCTQKGDIGFALIRLVYADFAFIDHFHLVKARGKWLIIDKIFHREEFQQ